MAASTSSLLVKPRSGKFLKNYDTFSKMDPYVRVTLGNDAQKSDVAQGQGKTPVWKKIITFPLTQTQQNNLENLALLFEAFDEDVTSDEFIGKYSVKLSQLKLKPGEINSITLYDVKNAVVGTIDVEFEFKSSGSAPVGQSGSPSKPNVPVNKHHVVGTVIVKPISGKFEAASGLSDYQELYLVFIHGDLAYQSGISEGQAKRPTFRDIISFQHFEGEEMTVRVFDNDPDRNEMIGEGHINIPQIAKRGAVQGHVVSLTNTNKKAVGELNIDFEIISDIFNNPVKVYNTVGVRRGEYISKKIKYSNPDKFKKNLRVRSDNKDLIFVKTETLTVLPGESGEIRFKFLAPVNSRTGEERCKIDIVVEDNHIVEESLLFKLKAI